MVTKNAAQIFALNELHGDDLRSLGFSEIKNSHHVFVSYVAGENEFLLEPLQDARIRSQFGPDDLQRNRAVEFLIAGLVNRAHTTLSENFQNLVASTQQSSWGENCA